MISRSVSIFWYYIINVFNFSALYEAFKANTQWASDVKHTKLEDIEDGGKQRYVVYCHARFEVLSGNDYK